MTEAQFRKNLKKMKSQIHDYMQIAQSVSILSKDYTKIGCLAISGMRIIGAGVNGYPAGYDDKDKTCKYSKVIHAEMNAILNTKQPVDMLVVFGLPPCPDCMKFAIAYGVRAVFWQLNDTIDSKDHWMTSHKQHVGLHHRAKCKFIQVKPDKC